MGCIHTIDRKKREHERGKRANISLQRLKATDLRSEFGSGAHGCICGWTHLLRDVRSAGPVLGVMAAVIVLFLVGFFFPSSRHSLRVWMRVWDFFSFFFFTLLCNAVSDLGKNMCQRDIKRRLSECVITSTSVSSLTAQPATSPQSSSHKQLEHYQFSFFCSAVGCESGARLEGKNRWPLRLKNSILVQLNLLRSEQ